MEKTSCYTYFSITSNGIIDIRGLQATDKGIFDPANITKMLGVLPFSSWKKGDKRKTGYPYYGFSAWSGAKSTLDTLVIEEQVLETISLLKEKIEVLLQIKSLYDVSFAIVIVPEIINEETPAIHFNKETIDFCYKTGTEIDIDMYIYQFGDKDE
ncbi:MAG: hypothetical protein CVU97_06055 [Firmicutes bacterium HGW-Firmicutes-21]|nr:MAG: hypothetical protein CVU97_06055 [Firmicutes bacterium HGW-Firmicutes-21]